MRHIMLYCLLISQKLNNFLYQVNQEYFSLFWSKVEIPSVRIIFVVVLLKTFCKKCSNKTAGLNDKKCNLICHFLFHFLKFLAILLLLLLLILPSSHNARFGSFEVCSTVIFYCNSYYQLFGNLKSQDPLPLFSTAIRKALRVTLVTVQF